MAPVVVRFAPSPTGYLHAGGARTAIFNWLYARKHHGKFILRIEDTDAARTTADAIDGIIEGLKWLGLDWDEGPHFQSHFQEEHWAVGQKLLALGWAYKCFCSKAELDVKREHARCQKQTYRYEGRCRGLTDRQIKEREAEGHPWVLRFKVPWDTGGVEFQDAVFGTIAKQHADIEDFVIVRADGRPLYVLSNAVDDIRDRVTHIIRGQDGLANTPKQILIYLALGAPLPVFAHMSLTLDPQKNKISKRRHGHQVAVNYYRENGFLPWALVNFLVLLGWSGPGGQEFYAPEDLIEAFDFKGMGRTNSVFNLQPADPKFFSDPKLMNMNAHYLRTMPLEELLPLVQAALVKAGLWEDARSSLQAHRFRATVDLIRSRFQRITDFATFGRAYFSDEFDRQVMPKATWLADLVDHLAALDTFDAASVETALRRFLKEYPIKTSDFITVVRSAVTGMANGPDVVQMLVCLGQDRVVDRLRF